MNFHPLVLGWSNGPLVIGTAMNTAGQPVAIAMNLWWSQYAREPKSARPYILRRLLGETWLHPDVIFQILQVEHSMAEEQPSCLNPAKVMANYTYLSTIYILFFGCYYIVWNYDVD